MKNYTPEPVDVTGIELPSSLSPLLEMMAENVHDMWARKRMSEGWTYGPVRDDTAKTNPCLVPYSDLPESEKEYDRATSMMTLKLIISLGYDIAELKM